MSEKPSYAEALKNRTYEHIQVFDWGTQTFIPDPRAAEPTDMICPSCKTKMLYRGDAHCPPKDYPQAQCGELYYCPECKRGWHVYERYWKYQEAASS